MSIREVVEGVQTQGEDEQIAYAIDTTPWGGTPTSVTVVVKEVRSPFTVVTTTVMPTGSASISGDDITLPVLKLLTRNIQYRVEVKFTSLGQILECYFIVLCER